MTPGLQNGYSTPSNPGVAARQVADAGAVERRAPHAARLFADGGLQQI